MPRTVPPGQLEQELLDRLALADWELAYRRVRRNGGPQRARRVPRARRLGLFALAMSVLGIFAVAGAMAVHQTGLFELDGNSVTHDAAPPNGPAEDWNDVYAGTDSADVTTGIIPDEYGDSKADDQFDLGSKDIDDVSEWHYKVAVPPSDKTDLENAYAALYEAPDGTDYLYLGADRNAVNGNAKLGFWIFQDHIGLNGDGTFSGEHKVGDVLIESAFIQGGTNLGNINVWVWEGADGAAGHLSANPVFVGADCRTTVDPNDFVCSINNNAEITVAWPYQGKKLGNNTPAPSHILAGGFNETGVNLSHFFPNGIPCFSNVLAETRAAGSSVDSSTEDFVLGTFQTCGQIDGHKYLDVNGNGALDSGEPGLEGWTINLYESDGTTLIDSADTDSNGDVSFSDIEPGDYVVCEENQTDWTNTDPGGATLCKNITISIGETETVNFGNGAPAIDVTKEASANDVCTGGTVTYTYTVTNTGNVDLSNVTLSDDLLGPVGGPISLSAGASQTFTATSDPIDGSVTNTVTATGNWDGLTPAATATATQTVTSHDCTVSVTKSADDHDLCTGGSTTYDFSITNNSDSFSWTGTFIDDVVGDIGGGTITLAPGETKTYDNVAGPPLSVDTTNTVTAAGAFDDPDATAAGDTATDTVNVADCTVSVTKSADDHDLCTGGSTTYDFSITNNSDSFSWTGTFIDDVVGDIGGGTITLAPGETKTYDNVAGPPLSVDTTNTVTAAGAFDDPDATAAGDTATDTVNVADCTVSVTKSADDHDLCTGGSTTYDFSITNNSDSFSWTGTFIDDVVGDIGGGTITLAPGETKTYDNVAGPPLSVDTTNTVTAAGAFDDPDATAAGDTATDTVNVADCTVSVTKSADDHDLCTGGSTTYDFSITNNSDSFSWTGTFIDDVVGDIGGGTITLAPGETKTYDNVAGPPLSVDTTNTVTAAGAFDDPDATAAGDTATDTVNVADCTVSVTKSADDHDLCTGGSTTYDFSITNNSDSFSWTGTFIDDVVGDIGGGTITLAPGETKTYDNVAGPPLSVDTTNTVTAAGAFDDPDATAAGDTATDTVNVADCTVSVTKSADDHDLCTGGSTTYDFSITNNSDSFSWTGTFIDDVVGDIGGGTITLAPGETKTYDNVAGPPLSVDTTNTVTAAGAFDDPDATAAGDTATDTVNVHDCSISITKTPDQTAVCNGTTVTYTYVVTNNSDFFTWTGTLTDDKLGTIADPLVLLPGESKTFTASTAISGDVVNTATADGAFDDPDATAASEQAVAEVVGTPCGQGCTPGFWQGGFGIKLWNEPNDPDWVSAGAAGTNPFIQTDLFKTGPWGPSGISTIDNKTMLDLVGTGGGSSWPKKAARDLIAAYLNASALGSGYPYSTATILSDWADAVAEGNSGFQAFHTKYAAANQLGCSFGQSAPAAAVAPAGGTSLGLLVAILPFLGLMLAMPGWRRTRRNEG